MDPQIKAVLETMPGDRRRSRYAPGISIFLLCTALYAVSLWGVFATGAWTSFGCAILNGVAIGMLFIVGHDACHGSLTPSRKLNRVLGRLAFLPSLHLFSGWAKSHNQRHHGSTNLKGVDPGYAPLTHSEFCQLSWIGRQMQRVYHTSLGLSLFYGVEVWWKSQVVPEKADWPANGTEFRLDRCLVATFFLAQCVAFVALAHVFARSTPWLFAAYAVALPLWVFHWEMGFITWQHHTHVAIPWFDDPEEWSFFQGQIAGTTHIRYSWISEQVLLNIAEHTAHHADPLIPLYRLPASQAALEERYADHLHIFRWNPIRFLRTLRQCQLYDYRQHRWLNFRGEPTTERLMIHSEAGLPPARPPLRVNTPESTP